MQIRHNSYRFILILFLSLGFLSTHAQSVKELERQRKRALERLETSSKLLSETKKTQKTTMNKLTIINKNIKERQELITSINHEISALDLEMGKLNDERSVLEQKLVLLKNDYAKMAREQQIHQSFQSKFMFVLSAQSFQQTLRRLRYLQEYSDYRKEQAYKIEDVTRTITLKSDSLNIYKNRQVSVAQQKSSEAFKLSNDEKQQRTLYNDLTKKEKQLQADVKVQQKKADELNQKIERLIAEEIRKAEEKRRKEEERKAAARQLAERKKAEEAAKKGTGESSTTTPTPPKKEPERPTETASAPSSSAEISLLTKEEKLVAGNFQKNQGRLPWPTDRGVIIGHYGIQQHPVLTHVTTNNKGIYIQTPVNTNARSVFEGIVTQRFSIPGNNNAVIVQHGNYRTVYANLTEIYVEVGQKVSAKQNIGKIFTDYDEDNKTELYFQVWKDKTTLNPESWISK